MFKFSLSTVWNCSKHNEGQSIVSEIAGLGFNCIEVNFKISPKKLQGIQALVNEGLIKVSSVHNYCPHPPVDDKYILRENPDSPSLSSIIEEERSLAVDYTKQSIVSTQTLQAKVLVLHGGYVNIEKRTKELCNIANLHGKESKKFKKLFMEILDERQLKQKEYFDAFCTSISELLPFALKYNILLGVENRFYYREIPSHSEMEKILYYFKKEALGYWHDIGHAFVLENLGFYAQGAFLNSFNKRMLGIHIHDILALRDHQVPFLGEFDWLSLKRFNFENVIKVIEVEPNSRAKDIIECSQRFEKLAVF